MRTNQTLEASISAENSKAITQVRQSTSVDIRVPRETSFAQFHATAKVDLRISLQPVTFFTRLRAVPVMHPKGHLSGYDNRDKHAPV